MRTTRADASVAALAGSAAAALAVWGASPYAVYLHHEHRPEGVAAALALPAGWTLMCAAMMLPTAVPLARAFEAVTARRPDAGALRAMLALGFLAVWAAVGSVFQVADTGVHAAVDASAWLGSRTQWIGASALLLAAAYEISPLKHRCLTACRTPRSFLARHWGGRRPRADAARIGIAYGASCAGCCWALMLVMFALGMANPAWMLALAAVMTFEKTAPAGRRAPPLVAAALAGAGLLAGLA